MKENLDTVETSGIEGGDVVPYESPETERGMILSAPDPKAMVERMEKLAELAPRMAAALGRTVIAFTDPEDLSIHGTQSKDESKWKICLSSAGAERVGRPFPWRILRTEGPIREDWSDDHGDAYSIRYNVRMEIDVFGAVKVVEGEGVYHTRKPFKGKIGDEFRPVEDIDREDIRAAAKHIAIGNAFKLALGLRNLSYPRWKHLIERPGTDLKGASRVQYGEGTKGGSSAGDQEKQTKLETLVREIVNSMHIVRYDETKNDVVLSEPGDAMSPDDAAAMTMQGLSTFRGNTGKVVTGKRSAKQLQGKWLYASLTNAEKMKKEIDDNGQPEPATTD